MGVCICVRTCVHIHVSVLKDICVHEYVAYIYMDLTFHCNVNVG